MENEHTEEPTEAGVSVDELPEVPHTEPDEPSPGLRWNLDVDQQNPFASALSITYDGELVLDWTLDPLTVTELLASLTDLHTRQVQALTGTPAAPQTPQALPATEDDHAKPSTAATVVDDEPAATVEPGASHTTATPSWWAQHKVFTGLLIFIGICLLVPFIFGGALVR